MRYDICSRFLKKPNFKNCVNKWNKMYFHDEKNKFDKSLFLNDIKEIQFINNNNKTTKMISFFKKRKLKKKRSK